MDLLNEKLVWKNAFEFAPFPVVLVSNKGETVLANQQAKALASNLAQLRNPAETAVSLMEVMCVPSDLVLNIATAICFEHRVDTGKSCRYFKITVNPICDSDAYRLLFLEEVTDRRNYEDRLYHQETHDSLTGLPNRALFHDRLLHELACARREWKSVTLIYIDLDGFKYVNDTLGHQAGDKILRAVSGRISACLRDIDTVSRMGSDEFAVILPSVGDAQQAAAVAKRIQNSIVQGFFVDNQDCYLTSCLGITLFPEDASDAEALTRNADTALHRAKQQGRNSIQVYTHSLNAAAVERLRLETSLRKALEKKEFVLFYQPIVDTELGKILGCEALIRWMSPEMGIVSPMSFIPIAEETGQIVEISEWVVNEACRQNAAWHSMGFPIYVSVNMSARNLRNNDIVKITLDACSQYNLDPIFMHFELTETALMENPRVVAQVLTELKEIGIGVSIDDFGTGYSSLSNLKRFPIDSVKIDRSFIRHVTRNTDDAAIAQAIIAMAHSLKLNVVAEGVDTEAQLEFLRKLSCNALQGYLISTPVSPEQFTSLLDLDQKDNLIRQAVLSRDF